MTSWVRDALQSPLNKFCNIRHDTIIIIYEVNIFHVINCPTIIQNFFHLPHSQKKLRADTVFYTLVHLILPSGSFVSLFLCQHALLFANFIKCLLTLISISLLLFVYCPFASLSNSSFVIISNFC